MTDKPHEISDYRILGYSDKDKQELVDRELAIKEVNGQAKTVDIGLYRTIKFAQFIVKNSKSF